MRYAIVSDIHANRQAWESVLADIDEQGADILICLGDVIGYGPMPQAVLDGVRERAEAVVLGNHDAAVSGRMDASIFNDHARSVIDWTREKLDDDALQYLAELPLAVEGDDILFVHAEVIEPGRFDYILEPDKAVANLAACAQRFVFYGHTHYPCAFALRNGSAAELVDADFGCEESCRYLVNVGSAGEPRNPDDLRARYVIFDSETSGVSFRRVEFDIDAYRGDLAREKLDIRPYFIQVADFESGLQVDAVGPEANAMKRLPVVPATQLSDQPRRLMVAPETRLAIEEAQRSRKAAAENAQRKSSESANRRWTIVAIAVAAALIPVAWLVVRRAMDLTSYSAAPPTRPQAIAAAAPPKEEADTSQPEPPARVSKPKPKPAPVPARDTIAKAKAKPKPKPKQETSASPAPKSPAKPKPTQKSTPPAKPEPVPAKPKAAPTPANKPAATAVASVAKAPPRPPLLTLTAAAAAGAGVRVSTQTPNYFQSGLLSYWPANEKDESTAGSIRIGPVLFGKPARTPGGRFDKAFTFNRTAGLTYGDPKTYAIEEGGSLTVSFWFQATRPTDHIRSLVGTASPRDEKAPRGWSIYYSGSMIGVVVGNGKKQERIEYENAQKGNSWRHVSVVIDGDGDRGEGEVILYLNGRRVEATSLASLENTVPPGRPLKVGFDNPQPRDFNHWGKIDELAIWNRPLTAIEIDSIFKRANQKKESLGKLLSE